MSTTRGTILVSGMFDMNNYGDLLFPLVAQQRLAEAGYALQPVAPAGGRADFADALPCLDIAAMLDAGGAPAAGILIGGGYIIHAHSLAFLDHYAGEGLGSWCGAGLWLGATLAAALRDVPLAWNAPGVPHPFSARQQRLVDAALRAASYVSVRDAGSRRLLDPQGAADVPVVPDPIAGLPRLWPRAALAADYRALLARKGVPPETRLLALHLRNRSIAGLDHDTIAASLRDFAAAQGLLPMLVAVGESHDDPAVARQLAARMGGPVLMLDDPASLREITAALAHSALYVGASLHGYIVATAYDVPGVLVARPRYNKFAGFLAHAGRPQDLAQDWAQALRLAAARRPDEGALLPAALAAALDTHWARVAAAFAAGPAARAAPRQAFATALLREAVAAEGPAWAMAPFLNRRMRRPPAPQTHRETDDGPAPAL
ncbi:polysaccharide pyruvyl transferase family protein [Roseomonas sp. USHLN139]|uniref:polysaccharide pyruvyl transferase family protein n=1 Tax=Roseomonas sp. USHLN139 TaxID=3081298 RepID=UPI003B0263E9